MFQKPSMIQLIFMITLLPETALIFSGCDADNDNSPQKNADSNSLNEDSATDSAVDTCGVDSFNLVLDEAHNYSFSSDVKFQTYELQEYPSVPNFDWSGVTKDILGHEVNPAVDVGHVEIVVWNVGDPAIFEGWLNTDQLDLDYLEVMVNLEYEFFETGVTRAALSDFGSFGSDVQAEEYFVGEGRYPPGKYIFVLIVGRGSEIGYDAVTAAFLKPVSNPKAPTELNLTNNAVSLTQTAILKETTFTVPRDAAEITVDWREMIGKTNAMRQEFTENQVGRVMLSFYKDKSLLDLQKAFLDLELIADQKYTGEPLTKAPMPIQTLVEETTGAAFSGFGDEEGTWLLSLWCTVGCNNPAPKYLAGLSYCP